MPNSNMLTAPQAPAPAMAGQQNELMRPAPQQQPGLPPQHLAALPMVEDEKLATALHSTVYLTNELEQLFEEGPDIDSKQVIKAIGRAVADGVFDVKMAAGYLAQMPTDPMQLHVWIGEHLKNTAMTQMQLAEELFGRGQMGAGGPPQAGPMPPEMPQQPQQGAPNPLMGAGGG